MNKKYQVFISSTYEDLKEHRDAVVKAVLQVGHLPVGMEMFNAGDQTQWETIKSYIDSSDYYIVLLAHRYGSKGDDGFSYTEREYDYAGQQGIPRLGFVIEKGAVWPADQMEAKAKKKLDAFKSKVGKARVIKFWDTVDKLAYHVSLSLGNEITINPRIGWVRATEAASPQVAEELARLSRENKELLDALSQSKTVDEFNAIEAILNSASTVYQINEMPQAVLLREVFLAACAEQEKPYTHYIHNAVRARKGQQNVNMVSTDRLELTKPSLEELTRLGLLNVDRGNGGIGSWHLSEKGQRLYTKLRAATLPPPAPLLPA